MGTVTIVGCKTYYQWSSPSMPIIMNNFMPLIPQFFAFLDAIINIQITTYIMMRTLNIPAVVRRSEMDKLTYLMDQYSKLQSGEKDHYHFIKAIGYKYSAVTNP
jgi:hypothetical protein